MKNAALGAALAMTAVLLSIQPVPAEGSDNTDDALESRTRSSGFTTEWRFVGVSETRSDGMIIYEDLAGIQALNAICAAELGANSRACSTSEIVRSISPAEATDAWIVAEPGDPTYNPSNGEWVIRDRASGLSALADSPTASALNLNCVNFRVSGGRSTVLRNYGIDLASCRQVRPIACCAPVAIPVQSVAGETSASQP